MPRLSFSVLLVLLACGPLLACGKKGPLYLPKKEGPVEQVSPQPATLPPR